MMQRLGWKIRLGILLTFCWICLVYILYSENHPFPWDAVFLVGVVPPTLVWGIAWVVGGFKQQGGRNTPRV